MAGFLLLLHVLVGLSQAAAVTNTETDDDQHHCQRLVRAKLDLWSRGAYALDERGLWWDINNDSGMNSTWSVQEAADWMEQEALIAPWKLGPVKNTRRLQAQPRGMLSDEDSALGWLHVLRGGSQQQQRQEDLIQELSTRFGPDFVHALERNEREHKEDCERSCEHYYCASAMDSAQPLDDIINTSTTRIESYSMGAVPPEDFSQEFGFPLDLIKVTAGPVGLFSKEQAQHVIDNAILEGVDQNEYKSGKYMLGGDWLTNLPKTRQWFNRLLESKLFPLISRLFPTIVSSPSVLRAHSVSLLKYNVTHPRTDVHIDNGILAMTLAMTPQDQYEGGGTYFEHFLHSNTNNICDGVLPMDVGHGTFRPGSVRHGGNRVTSGTRYILGAFLLIEDRVEHVRRLKNRGAELRRSEQMEAAEQHFEWALALNPKCTTCLKDWAEILYAKKNFQKAEAKIREALELLEQKDSDALFTLGLILSEQGRDDESIAAYKESVALNAQDSELLYNLGTKLGAKGEIQEEMNMYDLCTQVDSTFAAAWLNWGTSLAMSGNLDEAESKFLRAIECRKPDVTPMAMVNLARVYVNRASELAQSGRLEEAEKVALDASQKLDTAKPLLDTLSATGTKGADAGRYLDQFRLLRLQSHQLVGQIYAGSGNMQSCEAEFRKAAETFPDEPRVWQMLSRVLELQGKTEEAKEVLSNVQR